ncbi:hypothetical protein V1281_001454 [Nitrobacteraceae bacterium AZCC 2161]
MRSGKNEAERSNLAALDAAGLSHAHFEAC